MRRWTARITALLLLILTALTALSVSNQDVWWIRFLDFPRMQIAGALAILLLFYMALAGWRGIVVTALALAALGVQLWTLWPYQPLAGQMVAQTPRCADDGRLRILSTNVLRDNQDPGQVIAMIRANAPDIALLMETDEGWDRDLALLREDFPHVMKDIPADAAFFGMHVFSRFPLENARFAYPFDADTPMFVGDVAHPRGTVEFIGVHPRPPQRGQSSAQRDATVLTAAQIARDSDAPTIVAGDYNATPWNDTARLAMRVGELLDPRQGRGPLVSFDAHSSWMKWPLDQILWQAGPGLLDFRILPGVGSDHYPVLADLCLTTNAPGDPQPLRDGDLDAVQAAFDAAAEG